jgi:hypothetical protein
MKPLLPACAPATSSDRPSKILFVVLAVLAATCGALAVGWKHDHDRLVCYRAVLDDDNVVAQADCDR